MKGKIRKLEKTWLTGKKLKMSMQNDRTGELFREFMHGRHLISNISGQELYAVTIYDGTGVFQNFNPQTEFEKWAAVRVTDHGNHPEGMEHLVVPEGQYAVFQYKGRPAEAGSVFDQIFREWLPDSAYELDDRPHFALMGDKYRGDHPDSEEEFWIPVKLRKPGR